MNQALNTCPRNPPLRLLETEIAPKVNKRNGRPGMEMWKIWVCGVVRLDLNIDYDRLHELVNKHIDIRQMLGHGITNDEYTHYQTRIDNVSLLTPELLDKINPLVVTTGPVLRKKKKAKRCVGAATLCG